MVAIEPNKEGTLHGLARLFFERTIAGNKRLQSLDLIICLVLVYTFSGLIVSPLDSVAFLYTLTLASYDCSLSTMEEDSIGILA